MEISWELVAGVCGGIVLILTAAEKVYRTIRPAANWKKKVDAMEAEIKELKAYTERDYAALQHIEEVLKGVGKGQVTMMNHLIEGNQVETMKKTRDDLMDLMNKI